MSCFLPLPPLGLGQVLEEITMELYEHHKVDDKGKLKGLFVIDPTKTQSSDMWGKIDEIVGAYASLHKLEVELLVRQNAEKTKTQLNKYGATKNKDIRWGASIPAALLFRLQMVYPEVFTEKNLFNKFLRRYKGFRVCNTV